MGQLSHKRCTKCGEVKPLDEFYPHANSGANGRRPDCKTCVKKRTGARSRELCGPKPEPSTTYVAVHIHLRVHFPKTGICEECGKQGKTEHALIHGREYSRNREDYRELCPPCHGRYDHGGERSYSAKLTPEQAAEIRRRYKPGTRRDDPDSRDSLAAEFGVHRNTIWKIGAGRTWVGVGE